MAIGRALVAAAVLVSLVWSAMASAQSLVGDRLVLSINNVPYSQRQVEVYIHVKESLRKTNDDSARFVSSGNWADALAVFVEDMIILQESQRLGSFQAPEQAFDKYHAVVRDKMAKVPALAATMARLGASQQEVARTLEDVLRIAAFRRSKERQQQQEGDGDGGAKNEETAAKSGTSPWLAELLARSSTRRYGDALDYVTIEPTRGGGVDGSP